MVWEMGTTSVFPGQATGVCIRPGFLSTPKSEAALFDHWSLREPSNQGLIIAG